MMIQAVLSNPSHPEYGVATIPFPVPHDQYAHCMELLAALEIGDAVKADCKVEKIDSFYTVLKRTEMLTVNAEELNYLAKRLDSFDTGEAAQFQAMAHKLELFELKDLINLTFCCQQTTVITDFSDLAAIGRDHYMNLHGGSASVDELNKLDGKETARQLIESGGGTITPYGVVYDNGMKLEQVYDGRFFPCYYFKPNVITVAVTSKAEPEDTEHITWLFFPMVQEEIDRALLRGGITDPADVRLRLEDSQLPNEVDVLLDMEYENLSDLNELAAATDGLSKADMEKLGAVVTLAEPKSAAQIKNLAKNLDLFDFAPDAHSPADYGKYMIRQSGRFEYDENLDAFYDYEKYGAERMNEEDGMFTDRGYIAYKGYYSKLIVDEEAAPVVRKIFELKLSGLSALKITKMLNESGVPSPAQYALQKKRGMDWRRKNSISGWDSAKVVGILKDERYAGNMVSLKRTLKGIYGKDTPVEKENWIRVENTHEGIVSYEDFLRVQETFKVYQKRQPKEIDRTNAFECAHCGRKLSYSRDRKKLICRYGEVNPQAVCSNTAYSDKKLRGAVMAALQWHFEQFLHWEELQKTQQEKEETDLDTSLYERSIANLEKKKTRLYEKYREGDLTRDEYMKQRSEINTEVEELQSKVQAIEARRMIKKNGNARVDLLSELIHQYQDVKTFTKELERIFVEQVLVYDAEHIKIKWKFDDVFAALLGNE